MSSAVVQVGNTPGGAGGGLDVVAPSGGAGGAAGGPGGSNSISLGVLMDFIVQRSYHELMVLSELLPRKTDMERKVEIFNWASKTRMSLIRLLGLVKWASNSCSKVEKCNSIMAYLDRQSALFMETADRMATMARETLIKATLPNFALPAAVEVLTTGTYTRVPKCIRDKILPIQPISAIEERKVLLKVNNIIIIRYFIADSI